MFFTITQVKSLRLLHRVRMIGMGHLICLYQMRRKAKFMNLVEL